MIRRTATAVSAIPVALALTTAFTTTMFTATAFTTPALALTSGCAASPAPGAVRIKVTSSSAMIDRPTRISVTGLTPGSDVRLWAQTTDDRGQPWTSWAQVRADSAGRVDSTTAHSSGGSYVGVDPAGLFWSMRLPAGHTATYPPFTRGHLPIEVGIDNNSIDNNSGGSTNGGGTLARTRVTRSLWADGVRRQPVATAGLVGDLYLPPGASATRPRPGVLLLGGSEGGRPDPGYAGFLASQGFAVLGLAYFGAPGRPAELLRVPVEYGLAGARWLSTRPEVAGSRVGVQGTSKGGEYASLLASTAPELFGAVAAHVPSDVAWSGISYATGRGGSSWTRGGRDVPSLTIGFGGGFGFADIVGLALGRPMKVDASYVGGYASASARARESARFRVENITAPILFVSGDDDAIWPSVTHSDRAMRPITQAGNRYGSRHLRHPGAGHFIGGVPNLPTTALTGPSGPGLSLAYGGNPAANAAATRTTFTQTLALFRKNLPTGGTP